MKARQAHKITKKAALKQGNLSYARTHKALRTIWHLSRHKDGPRAGMRMLSTIQEPQLAVCASVLIDRVCA